MLKPAALEVVVEFPMDMFRQALALLAQLLHQGWVVRFYELVEPCLLGPMAFISGAGNGILAMQQHADRASLR